MDDRSPPRYFVRALARGLQVLEAFDAAHPSLSLTELATRLGMNKPTATRFLRTLSDLGYLEPLQGKRYRLGTRALDLGHRYLASLDLANLAQPFMQQAVQRTGEAVNLAVRDGSEVVYIARIAAAPRILTVNLQVGSRLPAHATSLGKALLMDTAPERLTDVLGPAPWPRYTRATLCEPASLAEDLAQARARGFAIADGDLEPGLRSVAAPVRDLFGTIVAAMNVSTHTARVPRKEVVGRFADALLAATVGLGRALGHRSP